MTEKATVTGIERVDDAGVEIVTIEAAPDRCESCSSSFCALHKSAFTARNTAKLALRVGDVVDVSVPPGRALGAGLLVFILPLAFFVAFYLGAMGLGVSGDAGRTALGFVGLVVGFSVTLLASRGRRDRDAPVISAVVREDSQA